MKIKKDVIITILERRTGKQISYRDLLYCFDSSDSGLYIWEEGNFSCDCNRRIFFYRNQPVPMELEFSPCGERDYFVEIKDLDGKTLYTEFDSVTYKKDIDELVSICKSLLELEEPHFYKKDLSKQRDALERIQMKYFV